MLQAKIEHNNYNTCNNLNSWPLTQICLCPLPAWITCFMSITQQIIRCSVWHLLPAQVSLSGNCAGTYPGEDGEEREDNGGSGSICSFVQWVVFFFRYLPLIGKKTEPHKPDQTPESCREHKRRMVVNPLREHRWHMVVDTFGGHQLRMTVNTRRT